MKILTIAMAGAALSLAACSGNNEGDLANTEVNQPAADDLNMAASDAANDAANAGTATLGDQQNQLEAPPHADTSPTPNDAQEQNVAGM